MSMKINYEDAIENLQKMFAGVDKEVIQTILAMHKGKLDPTIEDLLKLTNDAVDDDNIFDDGPKQKSYDPGFGGEFEDETDLARRNQEDKDMQLAMQLQQQEIKENERAEQKYRSQQSQQQQARGYGQAQQLFPQQSQERFQQQYQYQPDQQQRQQRPNQQPQYQQPQSNYSEPVKEEKKKKKFSEKMKDAKSKFFSLFKKGKKKGKEGVGNNMAGGYAEIDNLDDNIPNIEGGVRGMRLDDDLDDIPDIEANPYSGKPIPRNDPFPNNAVNKKPQKNALDSNSEDSDELDDRGINEEAKANFKFEPEMKYSKPDFDGMRHKNGSYPKFEDNEYDPDLKEYYNDKKIKDQGEELDLV